MKALLFIAGFFSCVPRNSEPTPEPEQTGEEPPVAPKKKAASEPAKCVGECCRSGMTDTGYIDNGIATGGCKAAKMWACELNYGAPKKGGQKSLLARGCVYTASSGHVAHFCCPTL